jgi:hypothetical protein
VTHPSSARHPRSPAASLRCHAKRSASSRRMAGRSRSSEPSRRTALPLRPLHRAGNEIFGGHPGRATMLMTHLLDLHCTPKRQRRAAASRKRSQITKSGPLCG